MEKNDVFGIGVDIENVGRFNESLLVDNKVFLDKVFTKNELDYCFSKKKVAPHLAVRFAAKEAVVKAFGGLLDFVPDYKEIEVLNGIKGNPFIKLNNIRFGGFEAKISLSHCEDKAIAFAIVTKKK